MPKTREILQVGKREDLADIIANVDAKSTPLTSMIPKGQEPANTLFSWQCDNYPEPSFSGVVDGKDVTETEDMAAGRAKLSGHIQIFRRTPATTRLADRISNVAGLGGKKKEFAAAIAKGLQMIKRDIECAFGSDVEAQADNGTVPYLTRGLGKWIQSTAQAYLPVDSNYLTPSASITSTATGSLTEANVNDVITSIWGKTGQIKSYDLICGASLRKRFSQFTILSSGGTNTNSTIRVFNQNAESKKIANVVDILETDFGTLVLHPSNWLAYDTTTQAVRDARGYILDMEMLEMRKMGEPTVERLEDSGGGPRALIEAVVALCVKNPLGLGKFNATS